MKQWAKAKLCDVGNLILGVFLFASPWIFHYPGGVQSPNALVVGTFIAVLSIAALADLTVWEEALNLIAGSWLFVSPWVLTFQSTTAMGVNVVVGVVVIMLAGTELSSSSQTQAGRVISR